MIPALLGLRHAIDRAIEAFAPLEPVIAAWQAASGSAEQAQVAPMPAEALSTPGAPPAAPGEASPAAGGNGVDPGERVSRCERCGASFTRYHGPGGKQRYCSQRCRTQAAAARARAREQEVAVVEPDPALPDQPERSYTGSYRDDPRSDPAALAPPRMPWELDGRP